MLDEKLTQLTQTDFEHCQEGGWDETNCMPRLKFTPVEVKEYLALLEGNLQCIQTCMAELDEARQHTPLQSGGWSPAEELGHIRACAEVWSNSIYAMLVQDHPSLPDIQPRRWDFANRLQSSSCSEGSCCWC